jgi:hypothetical protein
MEKTLLSVTRGVRDRDGVCKLRKVTGRRDMQYEEPFLLWQITALTVAEVLYFRPAGVAQFKYAVSTET